MVDSGIQTTIAKDETKKIIIALAVEDYTQSISLSDGAFTVGVEVNVWGEEITSGEELLPTNVTYTLSNTSDYYTISKNDNTSGNVTGLLNFIDGIPVTTIGGSFYSSGITGLNLPYSVENISSSTFNGLSSLTSIDLCNVKIIGDYAFSGCGFESLIIPECVTHIGQYAFSSCESLEEVYISNSVQSINNGAFHGCKSLSSVNIPSSIKSLGYDLFYGTIWINSNLTENENGLKTIQATDNPNVKYLLGANSEKIPSDGTITAEMLTGIKAIAGNTFGNCDNLINITIPSSVESIGGYAFAKNLISITFMHTSGTVEIGYYTFNNTTSDAVVNFAEGASWSDGTNTYTTSTAQTNLNSTTWGAVKNWTISSN